MIKTKVVCLFFLFCIIFGSVAVSQTEAATPDKQEALKLVSSFKELRYRIEAGTNYSKYSDYYSDLRVLTMKFKDSYGETPYDKEINDLLGLYTDIKNFWTDGLKGPGYPKAHQLMGSALKKYPGLEGKVMWSEFENRQYAYFVVEALITYTNQYEKNLVDKIEAEYSK